MLVEASMAILTEANYEGAGTCEFLVGVDGTISFLEVNTRLQVEHPVTEEVTGVDLVREQFRIAAGEQISIPPPARGHSIEFRINGEDPAANFMPAPGTIRTLNFPSGPGVRVDAGVVKGDTVSGNFDSMIAKIIVTGATRDEAIQRARRALAELEIEGIPTVVPFHRAVLEAPEFTAPDGDFGVYTTWIETEFADTVAALTTSGPITEAIEEERDRARHRRGRRQAARGRAPSGARAGRQGSFGRCPVRRTARRSGARRVRRAARHSPRRCRAPSSRSPSRTARTVAEGDLDRGA